LEKQSLISISKDKMKKIILIIWIILLCNVSFTQQFKFGWVTDLHIGSPNAVEDLIGVVNDINTRKEIEFVIATGDITETGSNKDLEIAKEILDKLIVPYYIIPGNHDTKWSESGCTKFNELWGDDKFLFEKHDIKFIGINSGIIWRGGGGHIEPEDLVWLDSLVVHSANGKEIYFFVHHQPDGEIDNWFKLTNTLSKGNIKSIFVGHGHSNKLYNFNGIPGAMSRSTLSKGKSWGYTFVECRKDSILFFEISNDSLKKYWGGISRLEKLVYNKVDSTQFINYNSKVLWKKELNLTLTVHPLTTDGKIFTASKDGKIYCFDVFGNTIWSYETHSKIVSRPVLEADILTIGTMEGDLYTFDSETGRVIQILGLGEPITSQLITIPMKLNGQKMYGVVLGTSTGKLCCYELNSLNPVWENKDAASMIETKPLFIKDRIIYGSWDNYLYSVDAKTGLMNWKWTENKNFYYSPAACWVKSDGKNVYVTTPDKYVSAIDLLLGKTIWRKSEFNCWESIGITNDNSKLLIKSVSDKFYITDVFGKLLKEVNVKYGTDTTPCEPLEDNGNILFGSKNGMIYLIDANFNFKSLIFLGSSRVHSIQKLQENIYMASNMDGTIIVFKIEK
jgi:outer membrane protein assembly factor BamB/predicted phosphodiesterase